MRQMWASRWKTIAFVGAITLGWSAMVHAAAKSWTNATGSMTISSLTTADPSSTVDSLVSSNAGDGFPTAASYGRLPMSFEPNVGQTDPQVQFLARGRAQTLFLTPQEAVLFLRRPRAGGGLSSTARRSPKQLAKRGPMQFSVLRMQLVGANLHGHAAGMDPMEGRVNYFHGNDPRQWHTNIPTYGKVKYDNVYPGVDLVYYGKQGELEYDFVVSPGGDPNSIRFAWAGAQSLEVDAGSGDLSLHLHDGDVRWRKPSIYQEVNGARRNIAGRFVLGPDGQVGFDIPSYDVDAPLIIDPALIYATYLGGSSDEAQGVAGIAVDNGGNAYVTGETASNDFPNKNALDASFAAPTDAFVTKVGPVGTNLVFSTYLGGNNNDGGTAIAIDTSNNVYVVGSTDSSNLTTPNGYQTAPLGFGDAFVAKISSNGATLLYGSYLGGTNADIANGVVVDKAGRIYVTGETDSPNFPQKNGFATTFQGGSSDAFVAKINPALSGTASLLYATFLGGDDQDVAQSIAVDISSNAYVTGFTYSTNFPTSIGAIQTNPPGFFVTAFVTKLNPTLTGTASLIYSTYLGGNDFENLDSPGGIAVDTSSNAYVTGSTTSTNFPVTADAFQTDNPSGSTLVFITKIGPKGTNILYSTYLGGSIDDESGAIAVLNSSNVFVTGHTSSDDFPVTPGAFQGSMGGGASDAFVTKLNPNLGASAVVYSSFLGGTADDQGNAIAVDTNGNAYVGGQTSTNGFPVTPGAAFTNLAGLSEGFIAKISPSTDIALTMSGSPNPVLLGSNVTYTLVVTDVGELGATSVTVTDVLPATITYVSANTSVGTCTQIAGTVSCNLGSMSNNASATITIVGTATSAGLLTNTAKAFTTQTDGVPSNNTATAITTAGSAVIITATIPTAFETGPSIGRFQVLRSGTTDNQITVNYLVSGTASNGVDYTTLPGSVTIFAGLGSALITVTPVNDSIPECAETVVLTLVTGTGYAVGAPSSGTVTIIDNDLPIVSVAATTPNAYEPGPTNGVFTVSRVGCTASNLVVKYTLSGTASNGVDYTTLSGSATISAGAFSRTINVVPINNTVPACPKSVLLTISTNASYAMGTPTNATVSIINNNLPTVTIAATTPTASEAGPTSGAFTVTRNGCLVAPLTVNYSIGGTAGNGVDYGTLTGSVTIPANATTAPITITPVDDAVPECSETVILTLSANAAYTVGSPSSATVTILDNDLPPVSIAATTPTANETGPVSGVFTVSRAGCTTSNLTVNYTVGGTAIPGTDYTALSGSVTIPVGSAAVSVTVTPIDNAIVENDPTVVATIAAGTGYTVGSSNSATVTILDNDLPRITVTATKATVSELGTNSTAFIFARDSFTNTDLAVSFTIGGSATSGVNYTPLTSPVTIPTGSNSVAVPVTPIDDMVVTCNMSVRVAVTNDAAYHIGSPSNAVTVIVDKELPTVNISATQPNASEFGPTNGVFTVTRDCTNSLLIVNYQISGTASNGIDYIAITNSVAISNSFNSATITVVPVDTAAGDGDKTVNLTLLANPGFNVGSASNAIATIADDTSTTSTNIALVFRITAISLEGNNVRLTWMCPGGSTNVAQVSVGAPDGSYSSNFTDVGPQIILPGTGNVTTNYLDVGGATNTPARYYRVRLVTGAAPNNPPVASNQTVSVMVNTATNLTLAGSDPDGNPITFRTNSLPAHGALSNFNALTGVITYTPTANFTGSDGFTFLVNDGMTNSVPATVSITVGGPIDSVGDGISDSWRAQYFANQPPGNSNGTMTNSVSCAACDPDGDGMSNLQEFLTGTDPTNSAAVFRIVSIAGVINNVRVTWTMGSGKTNALQVTPGAGDGSYQTNNFANLFIVTNTVGSTTNYLDVGGATNTPSRYYRVRLVE